MNKWNESKEISYRIDPDFDFDKLSYVPIKHFKRTGFLRAIYENIEIKWPVDYEIDLITEWYKKEDVYRPFGFSRPIARKYIERFILPDLTGTTERVEFLIVKDRTLHKPIGFIVVYEVRRLGDVHQELDLAISDENYRGSTSFVRNVRICILSYLFAVRGVTTVYWIRRRKFVNELHKKDSSAKTLSYKKEDKPYVVNLSEFKRQLERIILLKDKEALPVIIVDENSSLSFITKTED